MFILKGCPRCSGDLYAGLDDELTCMQCGKDISAGERTRLVQAKRRSQMELHGVGPAAAAGGHTSDQ